MRRYFARARIGRVVFFLQHSLVLLAQEAKDTSSKSPLPWYNPTKIPIRSC